MKISLPDADLLIRTTDSFLLIGLVRDPFTLFIETTSEEYCQYLVKGDLIAISAPEGGEIRQAEILLELVRRWHAPLMVLPHQHPGSQRLRMIVSAGDQITLNCAIQRGTHPEQSVICSSEELSGIIVRGEGETIEVSMIPRGADIMRVYPDGRIVPFDPI